MRIAGVSYPKFYQADASRGYSLRPGVEGWYEFEGRAYVRINSDGLRDREHSKTKPPNTFRVAILGDSYAEAFQVPLEESFWSVMQKRVGECSGVDQPQVEVINFGVAGYGTAQELITLRERVWQYSPDLVLLAFLPINDLTDNSRVLRVRSDPNVPYFEIRDGTLILDSFFPRIKFFPLSSVSLVPVRYMDTRPFSCATGASFGPLRIYHEAAGTSIADEQG